MMKNSCRRRGKDQVIGNNNKKKLHFLSSNRFRFGVYGRNTVGME